MARYKVKGSVGPWNDGEIITDDDLKAHPGMGGTKRLKDELGVIAETFEEPKAGGKPAAPGQFAEVTGPRSPANATGHTKPGATTAASEADASPNDAGHGKRGRS